MEYVVGVGVALVVILLARAFGSLFDSRPRITDLDRRLGVGAVSREKSFILEEPSDDWSTRTDRAFEDMVVRSGLDLPGGQALSAILLGGVLAGGLFYFSGRDAFEVSLAFVAGAALILFLIWLVRGSWKRRLEAQLPDMYYFLARAVRSGMSMDQAIIAAGDMGAQPLAREFHRLGRQVRLGTPMRTALVDFMKRVPLPDARAFATAVSLHREVGGNMAHFLDRLASACRERIMLRAQVRANTSLAKLSAFFIGAAMPALLLYYHLARPEFVEEFFSTRTGLIILAAAIVLEIAGIIWLWWLVREQE
jgi:tight adherence protein B